MSFQTKSSTLFVNLDKITSIIKLDPLGSRTKNHLEPPILSNYNNKCYPKYQ